MEVRPGAGTKEGCVMRYFCSLNLRKAAKPRMEIIRKRGTTSHLVTQRFTTKCMGWGMMSSS